MQVKQAYYSIGVNNGTTDVRNFWCTTCYGDIKGNHVDINGDRFPKSHLQRQKNDEDLEESWVA